MLILIKFIEIVFQLTFHWHAIIQYNYFNSFNMQELNIKFI